MMKRTSLLTASAFALWSLGQSALAQEQTLEPELNDNQELAIQLYKEFKQCAVDFHADEDLVARYEAQEQATSDYLANLDRFTEESGANAILAEIRIAIQQAQSDQEVEMLMQQRSELLNSVLEQAHAAGIVRPNPEETILPPEVGCSFEFVQGSYDRGSDYDTILRSLEEANDILGFEEFEARTFVPGFN